MNKLDPTFERDMEVIRWECLKLAAATFANHDSTSIILAADQFSQFVREGYVNASNRRTPQ